MDLVILAAGMGSRFGGLKQIEPIDENNNFIIDYSIFDAIRCGFNKVVFIIKEENYDVFRETIGKRIEGKIKTEYVFQKGLDVNKLRTKPWGTAHAILCCKNCVKENFAIINADDFYGYDAFKTVASFLKNLDSTKCDFGLVGYKAINTLSDNGATKRGVCTVENGYATEIIESSLELKDGKVFSTPLGTFSTKIIDKNTIVSTNMFAFTPVLFKQLEIGLKIFIEENKNNLDTCEYLIPTVVDNLIKSKKATVKILETNAIWQGVTFKEDKQKLVQGIKNLVINGEYPSNLWRN